MAQRKKNDSTKENYWGEKEEQAVIDYLTTVDKTKKNEIYNKILRPALDTLIECIIRRYDLHISFLSFLLVLFLYNYILLIPI